LLPIRHANQTLRTTVHQLLDILPDLTGQFEVLIVDDGSIEDASELAYELALNFPQVRVVQSGDRSNREAAIRIGLEQSSGEIVLLGEDGCDGHLDEIDRLWHAMHSGIPARASQRRATRPPRFQLLKRRTATAAAPDASLATEPTMAGKPGRPNYLGRLKWSTPTGQ
jgi:glycosyltransferase involved in cell wall biosynthesis